MKFFLLLLSLMTLAMANAEAYILEAKSVKDLISSVEKSKFTYKERGLIFGYATIQSCLYTSKDFIILKNYCFPVKKYRARGFTIISREYGIIDLYEENLSGAIKQDVQLNTFPDIAKDYFNSPFENENVASLNGTLEKIYYSYGPACWSTNYDYEEKYPIASCNSDQVINFQEWADETQRIVLDANAWNDLLDKVDHAITK